LDSFLSVDFVEKIDVGFSLPLRELNNALDLLVEIVLLIQDGTELRTSDLLWLRYPLFQKEQGRPSKVLSELLKLNEGQARLTFHCTCQGSL